MHIVRRAQAPGYTPPGHQGVSAWRLQGLQAGGPEEFAVAVSRYLPGAGAGPAPVPATCVYVVLDGEFTLEAACRTEILSVHDSVHLRAGEVRSIRNDGTRAATLLVVTDTPASAT
jgi:quercetin dioxygenase-like cupin family protein